MKVEKLNVYKTRKYLTRLYNRLVLLTIIYLLSCFGLFFFVNWIVPSILICISFGIIYHLYKLNIFMLYYLPVGHDIEVTNLKQKESTTILFCGDEAHYNYAVKMYDKVKNL